MTTAAPSPHAAEIAGNVLFFDTETTGLPLKHFPDSAESQPHVVQLAAILTSGGGDVLASMNLIINPGVPIPEAAAKVHGITTARAQLYGVKPSTAFGLFSLLAIRAGLLVAHNVTFDVQMLRIAHARDLLTTNALRMPQYCTMREAAPIVNLPPTERMRAAGFLQPKSPTLSECMRHFFGEDLAGAHDAMVDVQACARLYRHLQNLRQPAPAAA